MHKLDADQYDCVALFLKDITDTHLAVTTVWRGTAPGEIWVDALENPSVTLFRTPEGEYLIGDPNNEATYSSLKESIPQDTYLHIHPAGWGNVIHQVWTNPVVRHHPRLHLRWQGSTVPNWRTLLPAGYEMAAVDGDFLNRTDLVNLDNITHCMGNWPSTAYFLQHGFGFCVLHGDTIASHCIADCVIENCCEIGIFTELRYRRQGLALAAVAAAVEHCLSRGYTHIGWHCLRSNTGSIRVAQKTGFRLVSEYSAYSDMMPTENAGDMTRAEYLDWAEHYEKFAAANQRYRLFAADARALAGDYAQALQHLHLLVEEGWRRNPERLVHRWELQQLHGLPEFDDLLQDLRQRTGGEDPVVWENRCSF